jgi:hypothetical protein
LVTASPRSPAEVAPIPSAAESVIKQAGHMLVYPKIFAK